MKIRRAIYFVSLAGLLGACTCPSFAWPADAEGSFQRTLTVSGPVNLEITNGSGSIRVRAGSSGSVQISAKIKATNGFDADAEAKVKRIEANPPIRQSGNSIYVGREDDPDLRRNISISYEINVPAQTELRSHTGSGTHEIEGLHGMATISSGSGSLSARNIEDAVHAETGSGSITIEQVKGNVIAKTGSGSINAIDVAGGFDAHTGSGHIVFQQSAQGSVRAKTGSGGMDLRNIRGSLNADLGSGSITADGAPVGPWTVHTGSGSVRLQMGSNASFDLHVHTGSGTISVQQPVTSQENKSKREFTGKIRGGGVPVEVETGSGSVDIQ